jgi:uncharacterized membrane protein YkvA (DUF1232 family)
MDRRELELLADKYDDNSLWLKVGRFARRAGREVMEKVLVLHFCLKDPDTPRWARRVIMGALAYFVIPIDAIPDIAPFAGFVDDFGILAAALAMVVTHIKPEHRDLADDRLARWFGSDRKNDSHAPA